jgi:hypothetical protein
MARKDGRKKQFSRTRKQRKTLGRKRQSKLDRRK